MKQFIAVSVIAAASGAVSADTVSQVIPFDYDPSQGVINPVITGFDTMGGTRQLNGVRFDFNHNFDVDLYIESTGPTAVSAGDFFASTSFISILQLGLADDGGGEDGLIVNGGPPGPPFFGPGAFFIDNVTADLAAYDNIPGNDGPDSFSQNFTDSYSNSWDFVAGTDQSVLDALTGADVTTVYGGFQEISFFWVNDPSWPPPDFFPEYPSTAAIWVGYQQFRHFGEFTVTYDYSIVPTPGAFGALIGGLGLMSRRRR